MWLSLDPFDQQSSKDMETYNKYMQVILDAPHIFTLHTDIEVDREQQRIIAHR